MEERNEAAEEQTVNNNLVNKKPIVIIKVTESWKTPKRRYEMKPRKIIKFQKR